jgi:TonB-dependent SusC/RagA subfamily outer membrane receptor
MDNNDTIFDQFKEVFREAESKDFAAMETVWSRIDAKLDTKAHKTENKLWKKLAIAASVLIAISFGYQFFKPNSELILPQNKTTTTQDLVVIKNKKPVLDQSPVVVKEPTNPNIVSNADEILNATIANEVSDVKTVSDSINVANTSAIVAMNDDVKKETNSNYKLRAKSAAPLILPKFEENSVNGVRYQKTEAESDIKNAQEVGQTNAPLVVINDEALTQKHKSENKDLLQEGLSKLDPEDVETIKYLDQPLYIIDGKYYSEASLFGAKPTSPYAPLDKQEIVKTKILQDAEATKIYGERGKNGVVIITTKNGKPVSK